MTPAPLQMVTESLRRLPYAHAPYRGVAMDRCWNVAQMNEDALKSQS